MSLQTKTGFTEANELPILVNQAISVDSAMQFMPVDQNMMALSILPKSPVIPAEVRSFSSTELERYYYLLSFYCESDSATIISNLSQYAPNTWTSVCGKIEAIMELTEESGFYAALLGDEIQVNRQYPVADIIQIVSRVRRSLKLKPYIKNLAKSCVNDFLMLYMARTIMSEEVDEKSNKHYPVAYVPVVNLEFKA